MFVDHPEFSADMPKTINTIVQICVVVRDVRQATLGLELSLNHRANHEQLMKDLLSGAALPFDELN
jgi:hypothetical protein